MIEHSLQEVLKKQFHIEDLEKASLSKLGEGAWHDVYKLERNQEEDLVIRIKKQMAYGERQEFHSHELMTEYESSRAYYRQANLCSFKICPSNFDYYLDHQLVFTLESFMGKGLKLHSLSLSDAFRCGEKLGHFFRLMHQKTPDINGFGSLTWNGTTLTGERQADLRLIWEEENQSYHSILEKLTSAQIDFQIPDVFERIHQVIEKRRRFPQKIALVNQDITPENLIFNVDQVAVIDPFPRLDFDLKYAGYFVFCYTFLLPAYSTAPRYERHGYDQLRPIMTQLSDGFIKGYLDQVTKDSVAILKDETILWLLQETFEHFELLHEKELSQKIVLQMGDREKIYKRFLLCVKELENLCSTVS